MKVNENTSIDMPLKNFFPGSSFSPKKISFFSGAKIDFEAVQPEEGEERARMVGD